MAFTELYVRTDGSNDFGGSSDSATAKDTSADATATHSTGGLHTILDNVGGSFSNTAVDDFIAWDVGGTKELGIVTVKTDSSNITVQSLSGTVAFTNLANVTINIGGSWATIQYAADTVNHSATVSDDWRNAAADPARINVKATATYDEPVNIDTNAGLISAYILIEGYTTTVGDNGRPTWTNTTNSTGTVKMETANKYYHIKNFDMDMTAATPFPTLYINLSETHILENLDVTGNYTNGMVFGPDYTSFLNCSIHLRATISGPNFNTTPGVGCSFFGCELYGGNNSVGGSCTVGDIWNFSHCIFRDSVAGPGCHVLVNKTRSSFKNCVFYGNAAEGLDLLSNVNVHNCIFQSNTGVGLQANSVMAFGTRNAFNGNSSPTGGSYIAMGDGDVAITGDPFTSAATGDFSLDNTANEGAALREAGFPGAFLEGNSTGFLDVGAVIHEDPAAGGGVKMAGNSGGMVG